MTAYVDTSILAAYYCPEPLSSAAEHALRNLSSPMISDLTLVEFASAISRKVREKTFSRESAVQLMTQFEPHLAEGYYKVLALKARDYHLAHSWLGQLTGTLRTLDALHLAVAQTAEISILTADRRLAAEARRLGVSVRLLTTRRME
ncbi:MAG TPA: VapC toxin family PIN domain ribonuclease [Nitrospira sp.]|nr:VapC toxin family PIN domain ribonuclease [Nitrospira sp.]